MLRVAYFQPQGGFTAVGQENMPMSGPVIVAPIHLSFLDPPAVAVASPRQLRFMAKEELFKIPLGPLITSLGAFKIRRGESDTESIRLAISILEKGETLLVFPEGTRGDGVTMHPVNRGVTMLAKRTNAVVVPIAIVGTHILMPKGAKGRRHRVTVAIGKGFTYSDVATDPSEKVNRELFAAELQKRILELCHAHGLPLKTAS